MSSRVPPPSRPPRLSLRSKAGRPSLQIGLVVVAIAALIAVGIMVQMAASPSSNRAGPPTGTALAAASGSPSEASAHDPSSIDASPPTAPATSPAVIHTSPSASISRPTASATPIVRSPTPAPTPTPTPRPAVPAFRHIYLIVLENKEYGQIVGSSSAPYLNRLIAAGGLATDYHALFHPSEPNYLALFSGSSQGVVDDGDHNLSRANLVDQLEAHGKSWRVFAQNVPPGCYTGTSATGGADGPGTYLRRHEPAISFTDVSGRSRRCKNIQDFNHFDPSAADFELIVPNACADMHDCSVATGDGFLAGFVPRIVDSPTFADSALFITWDEGTSYEDGGGRVATIVVSGRTTPGLRSGSAYNHYSLLRTIEDAWGLGCLRNSCAASPMAEFFG